MTYTQVSIIIPTLNHAKYLKNALTSVQHQSFPKDEYEIIVVDNNSTDDTPQVVEEHNKDSTKKVVYVKEPRVGLHYARHTGARVASGEILAYIDDDVTVHSEWLTEIIDPFNDPQVACVGGKVIPNWEVDPPIWLNRFPSYYLSFLDYGDERKILQGMEGINGCNMAVRRSVLYEVGGFAPEVWYGSLIWFSGNGEGGLREKISEAGYKVVYEPKAWVYHHIPQTRLTPEYLYMVAFRNGIGNSYRVIRIKHPSITRMLFYSMIYFLKAIFYYLTSFIHPKSKLRLRKDSWYYYGFSQHQLRVGVNPRLRKYVLQETYF